MAQPPTAGRARSRASYGRPRVILVAGEALYDLVPGDGNELRAYPGGGPFNTARTLGRLGRPVAFLGRISSDGFGTTIERLLAEDGVGRALAVRTDATTTHAIAGGDPAGA